MKKRILFFMMLVAATLTSCLESGVEDLPSYDYCEISDVKFEYRSFAANGVEIVVNGLSSSAVIDSEAATVDVTITVPAVSSTFTEAMREDCTIANINGYFTISTASIMTTLDGSPKPGAQTDWSTEGKYLVTAADGVTSKTWTVNVVDFIKE